MTALRNVVLIGDAAERLRQVPSGSVDQVVTSPPYFRLRDYQVKGQIGLEGHVEEWVARLRPVMAEVVRVLTPTGSFWLNLGDSYATHVREGAPRKSLLLAPERLAAALLADGWLIRNKIVWQKPNPMPSSVRDRLSCTWEVIYLLVRSPGYYFDLDAIRQPHRSRAVPRPAARTPRQREDWRGPNGDDASGLAALHAVGRVGHPLGKNPGDVWTIASNGYRSRSAGRSSGRGGTHHATFPTRLCERIIRAGCPERRCSACRRPWRSQSGTLRALGGTAVRAALVPDCRCEAASERGLVLDPFVGAGTTAVVAEQLDRDWLGIELSPAFAAVAEQRLQDARAGPARAAA
jgi:DNA modification methylase